MAFSLIHSNRVEQLLDQLIILMQEGGPGNPLDSESVLVDNRVLGEWINLKIAEQQGIAANINYLQPHELFWKLARAVVDPNIPVRTPLGKEEMTWRLFEELADRNLLREPAMAPLQNYLAGEENAGLKRFQLSASIADLFDQYLIYRPGWINCWSAGELSGDARFSDAELVTEQWQQRLWKLLSDACPDTDESLRHRAAIEKRLLENLHSGSVAGIPLERLFVFGMTSMLCTCC
jgi:exodeoxyribonuclease V gamma subunit